MNILKFNAPEYTKIEGIVVSHKGCSLDGQKPTLSRTQPCFNRMQWRHRLTQGCVCREEADTTIQSSAHTREGTGNVLCLTKRV